MLPISIVVEVDALDSGVRLKCVFVQEDSTTSIMGNVEVIREALVLEVPNHVPFPRNVFFNGTFCASSRPRIPAQDVEACLLE